MPGLVFFGTFLFYTAYASNVLEEKQKFDNIPRSFLAKSTADPLGLMFEHGEKNPLDFFPKAVIPPATETSAATISYTPKTQKSSYAALSKQDQIDIVNYIYLNTISNNLCLHDFDNLAGFLIQKQLTTNA